MPITQPEDPILITGAGGFIGSRVVRVLLDRGYTRLRCFVRPSSNLKRLHEAIEDKTANAEIFTGNLLSPDDCRRAAEGISDAFHLAAGLEKSFAGAFMNSVLTTRNLIEALQVQESFQRFVNISSFAVYSNLNMRRGELLDETCPVEDSPQKRYDPYGFAKLKQDELVQRYGIERGLRFVILRPGAVYGPGKKDLSGRVGIDTFGMFLHLGGSNRLPLTHVDNCAEAIVQAGLTEGVEGEVFNVVDDELPTSREFLRSYKREVKRFFSLPLPYTVTYALCALWEKYSEWSQGQLPPVFNRRRCAAEWKGNEYSNVKLKHLTGWKPKIQFSQDGVLSQEPA